MGGDILDRIIQIALLSRLNPDRAVLKKAIDVLEEMETQMRLYKAGLRAKLKDFEKQSRMKRNTT